MLEMILNNVVVNKVFKNDVKFIENLDGHRTYLQNNEEVAIIIHVVDEDITEDFMAAMQLGCEIAYAKYGHKPINMYILAENCRIHVEEYEMPSASVFTIKMAIAQ